MSPRRNALAETYRTQKTPGEQGASGQKKRRWMVNPHCSIFVVHREADRGLRMEFPASGELNPRLQLLLPQGYSRVGTQWPADGMLAKE